MKKFLTNNLRYLLLAILIAVFAVIAGFGVFNVSAPSKDYLTEEQFVEGENCYNAVCYKLVIPENVKFNSVWINLGSLDYTKANSSKEELKINVAHAKNLAGSFYQAESKNKAVFSNTLESVKPGEWQFLSFAEKYSSYEYVIIYTKDVLRINELAFVGADAEGKLCILEVESIGAGAKKSNILSVSRSTEFNVTESGRLQADKLINEQKKFRLSKISEGEYVNNGRFALNEKEYQLVESVRNVLDGNDTYLDGTTPLGIYFTAIGTGIFGYTAMGVRIVPYLFTLMTIALVYFIGVLLFGKTESGLLLALLYAISGYSLFFANVGGVTAMAIFFLLLAFYSAIKLYKKGISSKRPARGLTDILIGGLAFSIAFALKLFVVYFIIPLAIIYAFGVLRQYNAYRSRKNALKDDLRSLALNKKDYQRKATLTIAMAIISHVLLPFIVISLTYLTAVNSFGGYYGDKNLFAYMGKHFNQATTLYAIIPKWGYAFNYTAFSFTENKYLFGNVALVFASAISLITTLVYTIVSVITERKQGLSKENKFLLVMPFIFFLVFFLTAFILPIKLMMNEFDAGYIPTICLLGLAVVLFTYMNNEDKKVLFSIGKLQITTTKLVTAIIVVTALVFFAIAIPTYIGVGATPNVFGVIKNPIV